MVQVDIFWSFAFGAGFAASAAKQLEKEDAPFDSKPFSRCLLWLSLFFVPSGIFLLWAFPRWETMQVGTYETIPAWLTALFAMTNITQGILGFWITYKFIRLKKLYQAHLAGIIAWFIFWFILVHGWDGTGFMRFFHSARDWSGNITPWVYGTFYWYSPIKWLFSPVAVSLGVMGIIMIPFLFLWQLDLENKGVELAHEEGVGALKPIKLLLYLRVGAVDALVAAIVASLFVHLLGWMLGFLVFLPVVYFIALREGGISRKVLTPDRV